MSKVAKSVSRDEMCSALNRIFTCSKDQAEEFSRRFFKMIRTKKYGYRYVNLCHRSVSKMNPTFAQGARTVSLLTAIYLQTLSPKARSLAKRAQTLLISDANDNEVKALYEHDRSVYKMVDSYVKDCRRPR